MWEGVKKVFRWIYDWMTVLAATLIGVPSLLLEFLNLLNGVNFTPLVGADTSLKIVTGIAITKALLAAIESQINKAKEP